MTRVLWNSKSSCLDLIPKHLLEKQSEKNVALSSKGNYTSFTFGDRNIRFMTSPRLERYTAVKEWNNGYIVVMAKYEGTDEEEEYIDLIPILRNLYIEPDEFLKNIKEVIIKYE